MSAAATDLKEYRDGKINLTQLAARWSNRKMGRSEPVRTVAEAYAQAEAAPLVKPGTWDEVRLLRTIGALTEQEYRTVSRAADPPRPTNLQVKMFTIPSPPAQPVAGKDPGAVTAAFNPDQPRESDGKFAPGEGDHKEENAGPKETLASGSLVYHTTRDYRVAQIQQEGIKPSHNGESGPGVYVADHADYAAKIRSYDPAMRTIEYETTRPLTLLDRTAPGGEQEFRSIQDSVEAPYSHPERFGEALKSAGYDGVRNLSPGEKWPEIAIHDPTALRPTGVVLPTQPPEGAVTAAFNPDQERDSDGKFAPEGGSADSGSKDAGQPIIGSAQYEYAVNEWLGGSSYAEDMAPSGHGYPEGGPVADKVSEDSRSLLEQAIKTEGTASTTPLYRGIGLSSEDFKQLTPGGTLNLPTSSFSPRDENAMAYAEESAQALEDIGQNSEAVLLMAPVGTQSIDISSQGEKAWGEPEQIVAGRFTIQSVQSPTNSNTGFWEVHIKPGGGG